MLATTVFPNDPDKKFEVGWWDEENRARIAYVTVPAGDTAPGGSTFGMGIPEVEALNGEPFSMFGFWWDYGGSAGFQTGKLSQLEGGCYLNLRFDPTVDLPQSVDPGPISGDQEVSSDLPLLRQVEPKVVEMSFGYPDYSATED
jgi:hypothetical protein